MIVVFSLLAIFIICAFKESSTTAKYQFFGVYGRFKAYLFTDLLLVGILCLAQPFIPAIADDHSNPVMNPTFGLIYLGICVLIYVLTLAKCPSGLRGGLLISMLITGLGISMKFCLFFIGTIWDLIGPQEYIDSDGNRVYAFQNDVYDGNGNKIGHTSDYRTYTRYNY